MRGYTCHACYTRDTSGHRRNDRGVRSGRQPCLGIGRVSDGRRRCSVHGVNPPTIRSLTPGSLWPGEQSGGGGGAVRAGKSGRPSRWKSNSKIPRANTGPAMTLDPDYTVVSDFRANGATRGSIFPVLDLAGRVLQARKPGGSIADLPKFTPPPPTYKRHTPGQIESSNPQGKGVT